MCVREYHSRQANDRVNAVYSVHGRTKGPVELSVIVDGNPNCGGSCVEYIEYIQLQDGSSYCVGLGVHKVLYCVVCGSK